MVEVKGVQTIHDRHFIKAIGLVRRKSGTIRYINSFTLFLSD